MTVTDSQKYCLQQVRLYDQDRYLAALFAPDALRPALMALYAFNIEIAKLRETVSEPILGQMRLQWWRDTIDALYRGRGIDHEVVRELAVAIDRHELPRAPFDAMIDAREADLLDRPIETMSDLDEYVEATSSTLMGLALGVLVGPEEAVAHRAGLGWGLTGTLRGVAFLARRGRLNLPRDRLRNAGVAVEDVLARRSSPGLAGIVREIAEKARGHIDATRHTASPVAGRAALLPLVLAESHLARLARADHDVFAPRLESGRLGRQIRIAHAAWRGRS